VKVLQKPSTKFHISLLWPII